MSGPFCFRSFGFQTILCASLSLVSAAVADEPIVRFDVPSLIGVHELSFAEGHHADFGSQKVIEVVIPVSSEISALDRDNLDEFQFDVFWNRNVYPLETYAPKTQTVSDIEGLISVEKSEDQSSGIGVDLSSSYQTLIAGSGKLEASQRSGAKLKYQEVPDFEILVASGTIQRGTGAFFRFHPSKQSTLEGGRELIVAYRVPKSWRGGVLKIECRARGHRKILGTWNEPFEESRSFVVPIYLDGDDQARQAAIGFVRTEQGLRQNWRRHINHKSKPQTLGLFQMPTRTGSSSSLPDEWVHYLIQSGSDEYLTKFRSRLPDEIAVAADQFVAARQSLFKYSR